MSRCWRSRGSSSDSFLAGFTADCSRIETAAGPEGHVDEAHQDWNLDERTHYTGEGLTRGHSEDADSHGNAEFELFPAAVKATAVLRS